MPETYDLFNLLAPGDRVVCVIYPDEHAYISVNCPDVLDIGVIVRPVYDFYEVQFGDCRRIIDANKLKRESGDL